MKTLAPGKVILSGEHSVVYGKPALAIAVNHYVETTLKTSRSNTILFRIVLSGKSDVFSSSLNDLAHIFHHLRKRYNLFLNGKIRINEVLNTWSELISFAFYLIIHEYSVPVTYGVQITINIGIPAGCGMGSSAATAVSILKASSKFWNIELSSEELYEYAMRCENLCHGKASGVDPYISLHGGFVRFQNKQKKKLNIPKFMFYLAITGTPESSTGECVMHVKENFNTSDIWDDFERVTINIEQSLAVNDSNRLAREIRKNHRLLSEINVVPEKVQEFISELEKCGHAAKISGAGSISGNHGGAVLIFGKSAPGNICSRYQFPLLTLTVEEYGVRTI